MTDEEIKALVDEFNRKVSLDPEIRSVMQKIRNQDADFSDTSCMFWRRSELLRDYLQGIVLDLPAGAREQLCTALLNAGYNETNEVMQSVQQAQDEPQGIHLNPVLPKRPADRILQVAHALEDPTIPDDKIVRRAGAPVANVNMSFHDKYIEENARIRAKLGMKPTITRYGSGCCKWCSEVAGRYRFGDQPKDIFRRHDNCNCTIIYDNQVLRGRETSSGRSKTWEEVDPKSVEKLGFTPTVNSPEQAEKLQENALNRLTLAGERDIMKLRDNAEEILWYPVTEQSLNNIPSPSIFSPKINKAIETECRNILSSIINDKVGTEATISIKLNDLTSDYRKGDPGDGGVKPIKFDTPYIAIHNHPSNEPFSAQDIRLLAIDKNNKAIVVIGNSGKNMYVMRKKNGFDDTGLLMYIRDKINGKIVFSTQEDFLKGAEKYGIEYFSGTS